MMGLLFAALRLWTPLAFATLGGVVSERSGVVALGLEGMMLAGAFAAVAVAGTIGGTTGLLCGLVAGILAGAFVGLLHAIATEILHVSGVLSGVALNLGVLGLTTFAVRLNPDGVSAKATLTGSLLTVLVALLTIALWWGLYQTPLGLRLRACGENPRAALAAGVPVARLRFGAVVVSGMLAGLGGVALSLAGLGVFTENMTAGRGYIALAAVIFGRWNPVWAVCAALFFGFGDALQLALQTAGFAAFLPPDLLSILPYVLTIVLLAVRRGASNAPAAL